VSSLRTALSLCKTYAYDLEVFLDAAPAPPAGHPAAIAFWDMRRGLFARGGAISLTTDGGRTFRVVLRTRRVSGMQAFGRRGAIVDLDNGRAFRSLDRGRSWTPFRHRFDADFATAQVGLGYRAGRFEFVKGLVSTRDGGTSWQPLASPCTRFTSFSAAVELVTPTLGWIVCVGQPGAGQQRKAVFRTTDGGRNWHPTTGQLSWSGYAWGAAFARDGFGLVWESRGTLYVTRDGGARWTPKTTFALPELDFGGGGAAFSGGQGLVLLSRGNRSERLFATDNFGHSWQLVHRWP
jgi:photosystem II stability/assembly factor-like uncharacterized protein